MTDPSTVAARRHPRDTTDSPRAHSFWKTLPGLLTAVAAIVTAVGGTLAILLQVGIIGGADKGPERPAAVTRPAAIVSASTATATATATATGIATATATAAATGSAPAAGASAGRPWSDVQARITAKDGTTTVIRAETLRFCFSGGAGVNLNDSLDIAFEKMSLIEVLRSDVALSAGGKATLRVTLTSGTVKEGTITSGCDFFGQAEEGRYSLYPDKLQKIEFLR